MHLKTLSLSFLVALTSLNASPSVKGLYNGLDPSSIQEHLALYKLFPEDPVGKKALQDVKELLSKTHSQGSELTKLPVSLISIEGFISFMLGKKIQENFLEEGHLEAIETISAHLGNRDLKGYRIQSEAEVKKLKPDEIDFARALLIAQQRSSEAPIDWNWIRNYEAQLDFMALQVLARLPQNPTPREIIKEINRLVFFQLRYRFPALSKLKTEEEPFSRLSTVLDSNRGVCLGVSVLYLSLAQRLRLPLEIIIPPGHIFVRYVDDLGEVNIETTARGINYPSENYLDVNTKSLKKANLKEVIGFVFYNVSSSSLVKTKDYSKAIENYLHCLEYAPTNLQAIELLGYSYLLNNQEKEARACFKKLAKRAPEDRIASAYFDMGIEYLQGSVGQDAIEVIIEQSDDESLEGIEAKQEKLQKILKKYPHFKAGLYFLAQTYESLSQTSQAIELLEQLHKLSPKYPYVELTLSSLYLHEYNFPKAWKHFQNLEEILSEHDHHPKMLRDFKKALKQYSIGP